LHPANFITRKKRKFNKFSIHSVKVFRIIDQCHLVENFFHYEGHEVHEGSKEIGFFFLLALRVLGG